MSKDLNNKSELISNIIHNAACLDDMKKHTKKLLELTEVLENQSKLLSKNILTKQICKKILFSLADRWKEKVNSTSDEEYLFLSSISSLGKKNSFPELISETFFKYPLSPASKELRTFVRYTLNDERVLEIIEKASQSVQLICFREILESRDFTNENIKKIIFQRVISIFEVDLNKSLVTAYNLQFFITYSQELYTSLNKLKENFYDTHNSRIQIEATILQAASKGFISINSVEKNRLQKSLYQALEVEINRRENYEAGALDTIKKALLKKVSIKLFFHNLFAPFLP